MGGSAACRERADLRLRSWILEVRRRVSSMTSSGMGWRRSQEGLRLGLRQELGPTGLCRARRRPPSLTSRSWRRRRLGGAGESILQGSMILGPATMSQLADASYRLIPWGRRQVPRCTILRAAIPLTRSIPMEDVQTHQIQRLRRLLRLRQRLLLIPVLMVRILQTRRIVARILRLPLEE
jgi:hypothetical protein